MFDKPFASGYSKSAEGVRIGANSCFCLLGDYMPPRPARSLSKSSLAKGAPSCKGIDDVEPQAHSRRLSRSGKTKRFKMERALFAAKCIGKNHVVLLKTT